MSDKKHIDRIFQEKLKDFEATPNPEVWKNIQNKLEKPKKEDRKLFPIWFRYAGVAAILALLLTIGNTINTKKNNNNNIDVVDTENKTNASEEKGNTSLEINTSNSMNSNSVIAEENTNTIEEEGMLIEAKNNSEENKTNTNIATATNTKPSVTNTISNSQNRVATTKNNASTNYTLENSSKSNADSKDLNSNIASSKTAANTVNKEETNTDFSKINAEGLAQNNSENRNNKLPKSGELDTEKASSQLKNKPTNAIAENGINNEEAFTNAENKKEEITIEEEIAKAENLIEKEEKVNRWQVYANIAPVYYNTLGKGSHIDDQFVNNSKSGEVNTSYGVNISYAFNDKLKLRSGVNALKLSYDTNNVILYENVSSRSVNLKNINFNSQPISIISATNLGPQQSLGILPNENASISQQLGYYEIPLELEYTISNRKFGINLIAGMSTMLLDDNKIITEFKGRKREIGKANNINEVSFSGNLGLGLDYKFSDKVKLNLQPTFKYQMNAYENTSGDFRPYIIGVYTGLSYEF